MVKPLALSLALLGPAAFLRAQVYLYTLPPPGHQMHYRDIWNLTVTMQPVSPSAWYFLEVEVLGGGNASLWKARTATFQMSASPFLLTSASTAPAEPMEVIFSDEDWYGKMTAGGGLFPPGDYLIRYRLMETTFGCNWAGKRLATADMAVKLRSIFPPLLLYPPDNDTVNSSSVVFTWAPPFPVYDPSSLRYEFHLWEVTGGQRPTAAAAVNPPFFSERDIPVAQFAYGGDVSPLVPGMRYGWQVAVYNEHRITGYSQVWSFVAGPLRKERSQPDAAQWLLPSAEPASPPYTVTGGQVAFLYGEPYHDKDRLLSYRILRSADRRVLLEGRAAPLQVVRGRNAYALDVTSLPPGRYVLSVANEKRDAEFVNFVIGR